MGRMVDGVWHSEEVMEMDRSGAWLRPETRFRNWLNKGDFATEAGRYHLYVALNCPWAHRTIIYRKLKQLEDIVSLSFVLPRRTAEGWVFDPDEETYRDPVLGKQCLHEVYSLADADFSGRVTVPVLWDRHQGTIVNNESAEIIRMLDSAFAGLAEATPELAPEAKLAEIDALNERTYQSVNNGVYRAGFASSQAAYDEAFAEVFATLDWLDERLAERRYLLGDQTSEADWRLFPTLVRFDVAYHGAFKCNLRRLVDYPNLWPYARDLYQTPGIAETVDLETYKRGYYSPSVQRNPTGIVPLGPEIDFDLPHGRG
jgi:putative glutathione S-transferase